MRPTKLTIFILIIFAIIGTLLLSIFLLKNKDDDSSNQINESNKETEYSAYPGVDITTEVTDELTHHVAIHYPEFNVEPLDKEISEYISQSKQDFLSQVNEREEYLKEYSASLYITFDINTFAKNMYSIVFNKGSDLAGANAEQSSKIFIVDLENNQFVEQDNIFLDSELNRDRIYNLLLDEFKQSEEYYQLLFEDKLEHWVFDEDNRYTNMFLTDDAIVFKFDKYIVTSGAAGSPEISIPLNKVSDLLTDEWKRLMEVEEDGDEEVTPLEPSDEVGNDGNDGNEENEVENDLNDDEEELEEDPPAKKKRVALTFDDGPHPTNTLTILQMLEEYDAKATFFMLGAKVDFYPGIAKKVAEDGHELGNHTWSHKDLTTLGSEEVKQEVSRTNEVIHSATGENPIIFRPPYGSINNQVRELLGLPSVLWTIDTLDWKSHNPEEILSIVKKNIKDGSIILLHDIHDTTVEATKLVLKFLKEEGYEFVTVSELNGY